MQEIKGKYPRIWATYLKILGAMEAKKPKTIFFSLMAAAYMEVRKLHLMLDY